MFLISCGFTGEKGKKEADGVLALADSNTLCMGMPGVTWSQCVQTLTFLLHSHLGCIWPQKMLFMYRFSPPLSLLIPYTFEEMCRHL